jgi:hypothetical protein
MRTSILVIGLCGLAGCASPPGKPSSNPEFARALAPVFSVDMPEALERMAALTPATLDAVTTPHARMHDRSFRAGRCPIEGRRARRASRGRAAGVPPLLDDGADATRKPGSAETALSADLGKLLGAPASGIEAQTEEAVHTAEKYGCMRWAASRRPCTNSCCGANKPLSARTIALVDGTVDIQVTLLDGLRKPGLGRVGNLRTKSHRRLGHERRNHGGRTCWKLDSEDYLVSLQAHEAQHFSDYRIYRSSLRLTSSTGPNWSNWHSRIKRNAHCSSSSLRGQNATGRYPIRSRTIGWWSTFECGWKPTSWDAVTTPRFATRRPPRLRLTAQRSMRAVATTGQRRFPTDLSE